VGIAALGQAFQPVLPFSPVSIILLFLFIYLS
jgi:hypothetical protein